MDIHGENKCYVCGANIHWMAHISDNSAGYTIESEILAEAIAKGRLQTSDGVKVQYDIEVTCQHCKNKNKYEVVK